MSIASIGAPVPMGLALAAADDPPRRKPPRQPATAAWTSGWCGPAEACRDRGQRCPHLIRNGSLAARPFLYCACACHPTPPRDA